MAHIQGESTDDIELEADERMEGTIQDLQREMATIRTGRASIQLLDSLRVDYYGAPTPVNQMANLSTPEASLLVIQPWDVSQIGVIEKAIQSSHLGLNPQNDGKIIRIPIPALTEERRRDLARQLHQMTENHRVAVRNVRRDANEALKTLEKDKKISEDDHRRSHDNIQESTNETVQKLDALSKAKEKEIMEIG